MQGHAEYTDKCYVNELGQSNKRKKDTKRKEEKKKEEADNQVAVGSGHGDLETFVVAHAPTLQFVRLRFVELTRAVFEPVCKVTVNERKKEEREIIRKR
jgi:hypothetical protein